MEKKCSYCHETKAYDEFYKSGRMRNGQPVYHNKCIDCYNQTRKDLRYEKKLNKLNPFQKLDEIIKREIVKLIALNHNNKEICDKTGINLYTLKSWKKKGIIPRYRDYYGIN